MTPFIETSGLQPDNSAIIASHLTGVLYRTLAAFICLQNEVDVRAKRAPASWSKRLNFAISVLSWRIDTAAPPKNRSAKLERNRTAQTTNRAKFAHVF